MPNLNTNTTLLNQPGNDLSPEIKTFYRTELLEEGRPNLVHTQFGSRRPLPKGSGKSIEWRRWDAFPKAMTPLTEGVTPDGNRMLGKQRVPVTVGQIEEFMRENR